MKKLTRLLPLVLFGLLAGCASENWDAPMDTRDTQDPYSMARDPAAQGQQGSRPWTP